MNLLKIQKCYLGLMTVVSLAAVSCTNETELDNAQEKGAIAFSAQVGKAATRITDSTWDGDELIGIKAGETVKTYKIDAAGKMSTEDAPYAWDGTSYDVLAWSPLTTEEINLKDQTTTKKFFYCDLLMSNAKVESKNVHFAFKHQMTRMWWEFQKWEGYTDEQMNQATISLIGYGAVTYTNGEITPVGDADQLISTHNGKGDYYRNGEAMMIPCEMWEKPLIKVEIGGDVYTYTPSKSNQNDVDKNTGTLLKNVWQRYYLSVSKKGLTVEMEAGDTDWANEDISDDRITDGYLKVNVPEEIIDLPDCNITGYENGSITDKVQGFTISYQETGMGGLLCEGSCDVTRTVKDGNIHEYKFSNITTDLKISYTDEYVAIGDYYYSDGTWGSNSEKAGCTTLGRVFKVGKHPTDLADYGMDKIHGYVICTSLTDTNIYRWLLEPLTTKDTYKDKLNQLDGLTDADRQNKEDYLGYRLTSAIGRALEGYAALNTDFPLWNAFKNANVEYPEKTSGWYIPSMAQLKDIKSSGVYNSSDDYWSSNVYLPGVYMYAIYYNMSTGKETPGWASDEKKLILVLTF